MSFYERQSNHHLYVRKAAAGKHRKNSLEEADKARKRKLMAAQDLDGFKAMLVRRYGNLFRAWKLGLDKDGNGRLSMFEFCDAARAHGYQGALKELWLSTVATDARGEKASFVRLEDIFLPAALHMSAFTDLMVREYDGSWLRMWICALDVDKTGKVEKGEFVNALVQLGFPS